MPGLNEKCWLQITSGSGPAECALAVAKILPVIHKQAKQCDITTRLIEATKGQHKDTLLSALLSCEGAKSAVFARQWQGTHQWICKSPFRPHHKRKNWFIGISLLSPLQTENPVIEARDIAVQTYRSSGPGGQHANKTDSAVRIIHKPTRIMITAQAERSQHMNKKLALARLAAMLETMQQARQSEQDFESWLKHKQLERGNPIKVFVGTKFTER